MIETDLAVFRQTVVATQRTVIVGFPDSESVSTTTKARPPPCSNAVSTRPRDETAAWIQFESITTTVKDTEGGVSSSAITVFSPSSLRVNPSLCSHSEAAAATSKLSASAKANQSSGSRMTLIECPFHTFGVSFSTGVSQQ